MKLFLLRPNENTIKNLSDYDNPWEPWYDRVFGFVVRAENEERARNFLIEDDQFFDVLGCESDDEVNPWLDPNLSICDELTQDGPEGIIIRDFAAA